MNALTPTEWTAHYAAVKLRLGCGPVRPTVIVKRPVVEKEIVVDDPPRSLQEVAQMKWLHSYIPKRRHPLDRRKYSTPILIPNESQIEKFLVRQARTQWEPEVKPMREIIETVAAHYGVNVDDLCSASRKHRFSMPRMIGMWLLRKNNPTRSLPLIGRQFGGKDHTTVLHAVRKIDKWIADGLMTIPDHLLALTRPQVEG